MSRYEEDSVTLGRLIKGGVLAVITVIFLTYVGCNTLTTVPADEIHVKQDVIGGDLQFWTQRSIRPSSVAQVG